MHHFHNFIAKTKAFENDDVELNMNDPELTSF